MGTAAQRKAREIDQQSTERKERGWDQQPFERRGRRFVTALDTDFWEDFLAGADD